MKLTILVDLPFVIIIIILNCLIQCRQEEDKKYCISLHAHALAEYINFTLFKPNLTSLGVGVMKFTISCLLTLRILQIYAIFQYLYVYRMGR